MEFRGLTNQERRQPTWAERDYLRELRASGIDDVYVEVEAADDAFWEALDMATRWHLLSPQADDKYWDAWAAEFRWAHGLPESYHGYKHNTYSQVVRSGLYRVGDRTRSMSIGQRLSAVEHLLDVMDTTDEDFANAVNERAAYLRIGVRLEGERFVRITSTHLHEEVTRPALLLLSEPGYESVDGLYRKAFQRALANDHSGAITAATSAVEEMLRVGLGEEGGRLQPLLQKARSQGWVIPAVEQLALKLEALRSESDAHTAGTDETHVAMLGVHVAGAILVHLGAAGRGAA